jgi:GlpG protein
MHPPPSPLSLPRYPVTGSVVLASLAATLIWWQGVDLSFLLENHLIWQGQLWRLFTSTLLHLDLFHLVFNLYWLWVFGTLVEDVFGHWKTAALLLFLAVGSSAAEYAFLMGGVGLSGVGYGLFGMLWVLSRRDERFLGAVDRTTVNLFVAWFFLCCVLTYLDVWRVGNIAHGAGAVLGVLLGLAITAYGRLRLTLAGLLAAGTILLLLASSVGRPYLNLSSRAGLEFAVLAYQEEENDRTEEAIRLYRKALQYNSKEAGWWYNLGLAYRRLDQREQAREAFERAVSLEPDNDRYRRLLDALRRQDQK